MVRVVSVLILAEIVNFDCTEQLQGSLAWILVVWVSADHLKEAVHVALIDNSEHFLINPLEARGDELYRLLLVEEVPVDAEQVRRNVHVDMPGPRLNNREVLIAKVYIELICEVWREKNGHTHLLREAWEPRNPKLFFPFHLLALVGFVNLPGAVKQAFSFCVYVFTLVVNISTSINGRSVIVDDFHEASCVFAQIEVLLGIWVDVPFKHIELVSYFLPEKLKEEVEAHFTFAHIFSVFVYLQLHNLEVENVSFLIWIEHSDFDFVISGLKKTISKALDVFVSLDASILIFGLSFFRHSI